MTLLLLLAGTLLLGAAGTRQPAAHALAPQHPGEWYVAAGGDCGGMVPCFDEIQAAVDAAAEGDTIKVSTGVYTQVNTRGELAQIVYIAKGLTIRGGYPPSFADPPNPVANPTTLDAGGLGRVVYVAGPGIDVTLEGLRLTGGVGGSHLVGDAGGLYALLASVTISGTQIYSNAAPYGQGGGVYLKDSSATLRGNTIRSNTAAQGGGGIFLSESTAALDGNTILDNTGGGDGGGGIFLSSSTAMLSDNTFAGNTANTSSYWTGGGGINIRLGHAVLTGNTIEGNTSTRCGGGVYVMGLHGDATLTGNTIQGNTTGGDGGGLFLESSSATLTGNTVQANTADGSGGGLYLHASPAMLDGNAIVSNSAGVYGSGGGAYLSQSSAVLNGNTILSNSVGARGGGLHLSQSHAELENNVVAHNQAGVSGAGLLIAGSSPRLDHTTIHSNTGGDGSGLYAGYLYGYSVVTLTNTIIVSQSVGILAETYETAILDGVLWSGNAVNAAGAGAITITHAITGNPALAADGCHLTHLSAAIDAGVDAALAADLDGQPRPMRGTFDIGADEFPYYAVIDPGSGGSLVYTDTQGLPTIIRVPPGAVSDDIVLAFVPLPAPTHPLPPGRASADHAFTLEAYTLQGVHLPGYVFLVPVTVEVHYSPADVSGVSEPGLELDAWTGDAWQDAACGLYDRHPAANWLSLPVCHLSEFALIGEPYRRVYLPLVMRNHEP